MTSEIVNIINLRTVKAALRFVYTSEKSDRILRLVRLAKGSSPKIIPLLTSLPESPLWRALESEKCPSRTRFTLEVSLDLRGGADSRIRTDDLLITNQLLYQLSYAGEKES